MRYGHFLLTIATVFIAAVTQAQQPSDLLSVSGDAPSKRETDTGLMLAGEWLPKDPHQIDYSKLPRLPSEHIVISDVRASKGVNQHNYLAFHDGRYFVMWSDGPGIEDRVGQRVKFANSSDGVTWSVPRYLTPEPPKSGPSSPHYGTRSDQGMRWIARGFWRRGCDVEIRSPTAIHRASGQRRSESPK
jgi:hypothetical protein